VEADWHKLCFDESDVMYQFIRPQAVLNAVNWLIRNNQLYCGQDVDADWHKLCFDEVAENKTTV